MTDRSDKTTAVILAGAVAKGAFEAGVLDVLASRDAKVTTVVGTSAGALNATLYAAGVALGREDDAARRLVELWGRRASFAGFYSPAPLGLLGQGGLSTMKRVRALLRRQLDEMFEGSVGAQAPVELRLVVTRLEGRVSLMADGTEGTTYEEVVGFDQSDLADPSRRDEIAAAAAASASFPGLFTPLALSGLGRCLDGGIVNNTPIKEALSDPEVERVVVVVPHPARAPGKDHHTLLGLLLHLGDIVAHERLFRDLKVARDVNAALERLEALGLKPKQLDAVYNALYTKRPRPIEIVEVRPSEHLEGTVFCGFFCPKLRKDYVTAGREQAERVL